LEGIGSIFYPIHSSLLPQCFLLCSVVLDHADDPSVMRQSLDGLTLAAKIAAQHNVDEVMDSIAVSLCKFTNALSPNTQKATVAFGEDLKARQVLAARSWIVSLASFFGTSALTRCPFRRYASTQAAETVFMLANRYGDCLRAGWRNILDVVVRIHKLGILPASVFLFEGEDQEVGRKRIPVAQASKAKVWEPLDALRQPSVAIGSRLVLRIS
jgi:brefeldin A-resistance guanine nucleotide exchange factor 1